MFSSGLMPPAPAATPVPTTSSATEGLDPRHPGSDDDGSMSPVFTSLLPPEMPDLAPRPSSPIPFEYPTQLTDQDEGASTSAYPSTPLPREGPVFVTRPIAPVPIKIVPLWPTEGEGEASSAAPSHPWSLLAPQLPTPPPVVNSPTISSPEDSSSEMSLDDNDSFCEDQDKQENMQQDEYEDEDDKSSEKNDFEPCRKKAKIKELKRKEREEKLHETNMTALRAIGPPKKTLKHPIFLEGYNDSTFPSSSQTESSNCTQEQKAAKANKIVQREDSGAKGEEVYLEDYDDEEENNCEQLFESFNLDELPEVVYVMDNDKDIPGSLMFLCAYVK